MKQVEVKLRFPESLDGEQIREELRSWLDGEVDRVKPTDFETPWGDKRGAAEIFGLTVSTVGAMAEVVNLLHGWLAGRRDKKSLSIIVSAGDDTVTIISQPTAREMKEIESFIRRHDGEA